jgi:hypothetical protein
MKKLRNAALLILLVFGWTSACSRKPTDRWYLMFPPPTTDPRGVPLVGPDFHAPLAQWQRSRFDEGGKQFDSFDSQEACEDYSSKEISEARKILRSAPQGIEKMPSERRFVQWTFFLGTIHERCVASDDPQLQSN